LPVYTLDNLPNNYQEWQKQFPVHALAMTGQLPEIIKLIKDRPNAIKDVDGTGRTALYYAVDNGNELLIGYLVGIGLDVNSKDNFGKTPLDVALMRTHPEDRPGTYPPVEYYEIRKQLVEKLKIIGFKSSQ